jgi:hypothetical protein
LSFIGTRRVKWEGNIAAARATQYLDLSAVSLRLQVAHSCSSVEEAGKERTTTTEQSGERKINLWPAATQWIRV